MISQNIITVKKEKMDFAPLQPDVYQVQLVDICDKLVPEYNDKTKLETVFSFYFVLLEGIATDLKEARGRILTRNFVPNYFYEGKKGKNVTMQIVEALLGREQTAKEEAYWDATNWNNFIGSQARVLIENTTKDGVTYSNIKSFLPKKELMAGLTEKELSDVKERIEKMEEKSNKPKKEDEYPDVNPNLVDVEEEINIDNIV